MEFKEICSPPGKFALFQEKVTFPEADQVLFKDYLFSWQDIIGSLDDKRFNHCQVCSKFQGKLAVTETDEDYERLVHLHTTYDYDYSISVMILQTRFK